MKYSSQKMARDVSYYEAKELHCIGLENFRGKVVLAASGQDNIDLVEELSELLQKHSSADLCKMLKNLS